MVNNTASERNLNIDLVKSTALFLVVSVHAFLNLNYYLITLKFTPFTILFTVLRQVCICCVPLFLLSTGFLNGGKEIKMDKARLIGLLRVLIPYFISSLLIIIFLKLRHIDFDPFDLLFGMQKYAYGWYVEMFIGLYLLIPYINMAYNKLETRKNKLIMICVFIFLAQLPSVLKYGEDDFAADYWISLYPITYYLAGAFIKEYGVKIKSFKLVFIMFFSIVWNSSVYIFMTNGCVFEWESMIGFSSLYVLIASVCLFCLLTRINLTKMHKPLKKVMITVSVSTLPAYLISRIFDDIVYGYVINISSANFKGNFYYMPLTVIIVFTASVLCGIPIQMLSTCLTKKALEKKEKLVLKR